MMLLASRGQGSRAVSARRALVIHRITRERLITPSSSIGSLQSGAVERLRRGMSRGQAGDGVESPPNLRALGAGALRVHQCRRFDAGPVMERLSRASTHRETTPGRQVWEAGASKKESS